VKKNAGVFTVLAVVLTFFGISNLPKNSSGGTSTTQAVKGNESPSKASGGVPSVKSPCREIQKRLQPFVADAPQQDWRLPDFCYATQIVSHKLSKAHDLEFVIATAPNPISTHLPLLFDRIIEIIREAAQDNNYSYDSAWLPWNEAKEYARLPDELAAQDAQDFQENQPGLLVFRKTPPDPAATSTDPHTPPAKPHGPYEGGLAVFVVSELPTGGIDQEQFDNALAWIQELGGLSPDRKLKILGPTFSGSLPSLYQSLHLHRLDSFPGKNAISVSSGSVSSDISIHWFSEQLNKENLGKFETALEGDSVLVDRFCEYIASQLYDTKRIAILSEDDTAFGAKRQLKGPTNKDIRTEDSGAGTYLYYPRDIATLRSAYEQQSIFSSAKQPSNTNAVATTLRGDLSEPASSDHDTVRSYGGQLTPLAQESVLLGITDILKEKKIQFVILQSTNSLDQIFLSQFFRRSLPETRIVIDGADLLFRRGAEGASLRGVMVLSTYPLLTWQQDWISSQQSGIGEGYRIFGEDTAEGLYIAARGLFPNQGSTVPIANYAPPAWARSSQSDDEDRRPATWLTVIGHRQFWPLAVLNSHTLPGTKTHSILPADSSQDDKLIATEGDPHPVQQLPDEFWILLILCFVVGLVHLLWCARGSISPLPSPFRLAQFAPVPRWQHSALIGLGSVLVATVAVLVAADSGLLKWELGRYNGTVAALILAVFLSPVLACAMNYRLPQMTYIAFTDSHSVLSRRGAAGTSILLLMAFMLLQRSLVQNLMTANLMPAFWRSVHLLSGVSALLPQLFLIAGMYCWFWFNLRGLSLFGNDRPLLPKIDDLKLADGTPIMPMFSREQAAERTEFWALPIGAGYFALLGLICPIVVFVCGALLRGFKLRTLGEQSFGIFIFFWLTFCISLILTDTAQIWSTWSRLRALLLHLDRLPLRRTLNALQGLSWQSVWAMSGNVLSERYCLISRQIESLRHLKNQMDAWKPDDLSVAKNQVGLLKKITDCQEGQIKTLVEWYVDLGDKPISNVGPMRDVQEEIASIAAFVLATVLIPSWRTETDSLLVDRSRPTNIETDNNRGPVIPANFPAHVLAAEEFFVLPYVGFIQNILGRMRAIVLGSLFLFVAATLGMSSYPFDPLPILGGIFLAVFIITGTTIIVIYAGLHRDATLSYITGTRPGELGFEFWRQLFTFGVGPLLGLLTTLFPSITDFVISWLQPSTQAIK
jgi:hypothetical protein